jgi:hypothetical protein
LQSLRISTPTPDPDFDGDFEDPEHAVANIAMVTSPVIARPRPILACDRSCYR